MSPALPNSLWNVLQVNFFDVPSFVHNQVRQPPIFEFSRAMWDEHFKEPTDTRPKYAGEIVSHIRHYFFDCSWNQVYDLLEWISNNRQSEPLDARINVALERELSGYRLIAHKFVDVIAPEEVAAVQDALSSEVFAGAQKHLLSALQKLADRANPDYRNSIKESISAVESVAREITGQPGATLGQALKELRKKWDLHASLEGAFSKMYGYTSDEGGIRHAMLEEPNLTAADARFFLVACSNFVNYLKTKV